MTCSHHSEESTQSLRPQPTTIYFLSLICSEERVSEGSTMEKEQGGPMHPERCDFRQALLLIGPDLLTK